MASCEHCGGSNITMHGCVMCGAPVCCQDCCRETTREIATVKEDTSHWAIYDNSVGGWFAWNSLARLRIDLVHKGTFSQAVEAFNLTIGDYYSSRGGTR